jgi:hypothetical protein
MENNYFQPLLQTPPASSAVHWNAIIELSEEFPCSSLVQMMKAKLATDLNKPEKGSALKSASISVLDRALFKQYIENEFIPTHKSIPVKEWVWEVPQEQNNQKPENDISEIPTISENEEFTSIADAVSISDAQPETSTLESAIPEIQIIPETLTSDINIDDAETISEEAAPIVIFTPETHEVEQVIEIPQLVLEEEPSLVDNDVVDDLLASLKALKFSHFQYEHNQPETPEPQIQTDVEPVQDSLSEVNDWETESYAAPFINEMEAEDLPQSIQEAIWEAPPLFIPPYEGQSIDEAHLESESNTVDNSYAALPDSEIELNQEILLSDDEKTFLHSEIDASVPNAMLDYVETDADTNLVAVPLPELLFNSVSDDYFADADAFVTVNSTSDDDDLIDRFLANSPKISVQKPEPGISIQPLNISELQLPHIPEITTENMASIYLRQGNRDKAIETYLKLILKFPEKTAYFTAQIQHAAQAAK